MTLHAFRPLTGNIFGEIKLPGKGINRLCTGAITGEISFAPDKPHLMGCRNLDIEYKVQLKYVSQGLIRFFEWRWKHFIFTWSMNYIWLARSKSDGYLFSSPSLVSWWQLSLLFQESSSSQCLQSQIKQCWWHHWLVLRLNNDMINSSLSLTRNKGEDS